MITAATAPLAVRMRPSNLDELVGQQNALKPGSPLRNLANPDADAAASIVLFGAPGIGKTTIAQIIARRGNRRYKELSAITAGVKEVRDVIEGARNDLDAFGVRTVLFLDEIHRFSKAQQDALLPAVENGWVILIAATTENPSFSIIAPLLSRSLIVRLEALSDDDVQTVIERALSSAQGLGGLVDLSPEALEAILRLSQGDARRALTLLEASAIAAIATMKPKSKVKPKISVEHVSAAADQAIVHYDKSGDQHYDVISAFIKSVRGSDADAAIHYLARMIEAGEDPRFIARRLMILAAEDIGLADPQALVLATATAQCVQLIGMPEGRIPLAEATVYLALAPKSNSAYKAINSALEDVRAGRIPEVPLPLRSSNYAGAAGLGHGKGYKYPHDDSRAVLEQRYLGDELIQRQYYVPKDLGAEHALAERWPKLRSIIRAFKK
jgi:putative ATPase